MLEFDGFDVVGLLVIIGLVVNGEVVVVVVVVPCVVVAVVLVTVVEEVVDGSIVVVVEVVVDGSVLVVVDGVVELVLASLLVVCGAITQAVTGTIPAGHVIDPDWSSNTMGVTGVLRLLLITTLG